jgi:hypothetical protein
MRYLKIIQFLVSLLLVFLILREISVGELKTALTEVLSHPGYFFAGVCIPAIGFFAGSVRLKLILSVQGISVPLRRLVTINLIGAFYNQALPSTIGGDVVRSVMLSRLQKPGARDAGRVCSSVTAFASVGADRTLGICGLLIMGTVALFFNSMRFDVLKRIDLAQSLTYVMGLVFFAAVVACIVWGLIRKSENHYLKAVLERARQALLKLSGIVRNKKYLACTILLSIVIQIAVIVEFYMLSKALGLNIDAFDLAVIIPVVDLVSMLPITIGGIGLRENTLLFMGASIGVTPVPAVMLSYLYLGIKILWGLLGGLFYLKEQLMSGLN